ncbi:MAG: hypothetical protein IKM90_02645, partial [Bacteroidaceae bacterium]|nr:hypothetical protein [Bacteroidaceae bacterium]
MRCKYSHFIIPNLPLSPFAVAVLSLLGTIVENDGVTERDADRTTPESCVVQRQLAAMTKNDCGACVMETSSHGLFLGRLKGARY